MLEPSFADELPFSDLLKEINEDFSAESDLPLSGWSTGEFVEEPVMFGFKYLKGAREVSDTVWALFSWEPTIVPDCFLGINGIAG